MNARLLIGGREVYDTMWAAIEAAQVSIQLETYIWKDGRVADRFLALLQAAAQRGLRVQLLLDCFGSDSLPKDYFAGLTAAGAKLTWFNPVRVLRYNFRNHRKLLVIDGHRAIVGGLNIADEYDGDGISQGWRDFAVELQGAIVTVLADSFARMQTLARFTPRALKRFARSNYRLPAPAGNARLLCSGPGTRGRRMRSALRADLGAASHVGVYAAYLLPPVRMRRALGAVAQRGQVQMITGAQCDVPLVQWAASRLYGYWLRCGVQLYEYVPQVLHGKLLVIDDVVYVGSANLDVRSLRINYELLVRIESTELAAQVRACLAEDTLRSRQVTAQHWRDGRRWWRVLRSWWAYLLVVRVDPYLAYRKLRHWA